MLSFFFLLPWNFTTKKRWCSRGECPHKTPPNAVKYGVWNLCSTTISLSRIKIRAAVIFSNGFKVEIEIRSGFNKWESPDEGENWNQIWVWGKIKGGEGVSRNLYHQQNSSTSTHMAMATVFSTSRTCSSSPHSKNHAFPPIPNTHEIPSSHFHSPPLPISESLNFVSQQKTSTALLLALMLVSKKMEKNPNRSYGGLWEERWAVAMEFWLGSYGFTISRSVIWVFRSGFEVAFSAATHEEEAEEE